MSCSIRWSRLRRAVRAVSFNGQQSCNGNDFRQSVGDARRQAGRADTAVRQGFADRRRPLLRTGQGSSSGFRGQMTRRFAGRGSSHAIANDKCACLGQHDEEVFIGAARTSAVGEARSGQSCALAHHVGGLLLFGSSLHNARNDVPSEAAIGAAIAGFAIIHATGSSRVCPPAVFSCNKLAGKRRLPAPFSACLGLRQDHHLHAARLRG